MQIFLKFLTGKTVVIDIKADDMVEQIRTLIFDKEGIPPDQARLVFKGVQLEDGRTLESYGISHEDSVHVILRLRGGGGSFTDVSQGHMRQGVMTDDAPDWRCVSNGLILCGVCQNISCDAYGKEVLISQKFIDNYEIIHARESCPMCRQKVEITNCGFINCHWKYYGSLEDGTIKSTTWAQTALNIVEFFDEDKCGKTRWNSLMISTRNNNENSIKIAH